MHVEPCEPPGNNGTRHSRSLQASALAAPASVGAMPVPPLRRRPRCTHCNEVLQGNPFVWDDRRYCAWLCAHEAGDRSHCAWRVCGCTKYQIALRILRDHRRVMRVMEQVVDDLGHGDTLQERIFAATGDYGIDMEANPQLDKSDDEDPERQLQEELEAARAQLAERSSRVAMAQNMLDLGSIRTEMERARMRAEDRRV